VPAPFNLAAVICAACGSASGAMTFSLLGWVAYFVVQFLYARARLRHQPWLPVTDAEGRPEVRTGGGVIWVHAYKPLTGMRQWIPAGEWHWGPPPAPPEAGAGSLIPQQAVPWVAGAGGFMAGLAAGSLFGGRGRRRWW
jgi:hypothetical protein